MWSFFYSNRNCCQCLTYSTAQSPLWELLWTTKERLVIHMSFISRLIESLYFICALKNAVGSRSFVRGIVSPTEPHTSHLSFISHMPYLVALESLHHVWKGYHWGCSSRLTWSLPISDLKSWCYYNKRRKRVHVIHWVCWSWVILLGVSAVQISIQSIAEIIDYHTCQWYFSMLNGTSRVVNPHCTWASGVWRGLSDGPYATG